MGFSIAVEQILKETLVFIPVIIRSCRGFRGDHRTQPTYSKFVHLILLIKYCMVVILSNIISYE